MSKSSNFCHQIKTVIPFRLISYLRLEKLRSIDKKYSTVGMLSGTNVNENFMSVYSSVRPSPCLSPEKVSLENMKIIYNTFDSDVWYSIPIETKCHTDFILFATRLRIKQRFDFYQFIPDLRHYIPVTHFVHFPREKSDFVPVIPLPSCQETFRLMAISCICQHSSGPVKAADDDAGKLQPVFLKRLYLLHICIFSFFLFTASLTTI